MISYAALLATIAPVFLMIGAGWGVRRFGLMDQGAENGLTRLIIYFLYPCLMLHIILGNRALDEPRVLILAPLFGFLITAGGVLIALFTAAWFGIKPGVRRRTFAAVTGVFNYGYIPIPIATLLFDLETVGVLVVFNVGVEIAIWTVALVVMSGQWDRRAWRKLLNPPLITLFIALPLNFLGAGDWMPDFVLKTVGMLGQCAIPLGILLIGVVYYELLKGIKWQEHLNISLGACVLRLAMLPLIILGIAWLLPLPIELKRVMAIQAAMPCGVFTVLLARYFKADTETAIRIAISTTVVGVLLIPFWIKTGLAWLE